MRRWERGKERDKKGQGTERKTKTGREWKEREARKIIKRKREDWGSGRRGKKMGAKETNPCEERKGEKTRETKVGKR